MFKKFKNIKNTVIIFLTIFLVFVIASNIFLIVTNIRLDKRIDDLTRELNSYCTNID